MQQQTTTTRRRGWLLLAIVAGLALLSGIYPLLAEPENRVMAAILIGIAAIALGVSVARFRRGG
ncbi:MAG TPA: hypothetical protein VF115_09505 [Acidimicrobiia bacterium]